LLLIKIPDQLLYVVDGSDHAWLALVAHHQRLVIKHRSVNIGLP
jgi:hypothetical protein